MRFHPQHLLLAATLTATALAQSAKPTPPDAHPTFAVATIKPHDPASPRQGFDIKGDRITIRNESVAKLLQMAYAIHPRQIANAPDWLFHDTYDIEGKIDSRGEPTVAAMRDLIPQLLADRFAFKFHREQRELSVYAIQIAKVAPGSYPPPTPTPNPIRTPAPTAPNHRHRHIRVHGRLHPRHAVLLRSPTHRPDPPHRPL